jgi:hypothetical protein
MWFGQMLLLSVQIVPAVSPVWAIFRLFIGQSFAFGQLFEKCRFLHGKGYDQNLTTMGSAAFWVIFFTNSSGHPACQSPVLGHADVLRQVFEDLEQPLPAFQNG